MRCFVVLLVLTLLGCGIAEEGDDNAPKSYLQLINGSGSYLEDITVQRQSKFDLFVTVLGEDEDLPPGGAVKVSIPPDKCDWVITATAINLIGENAYTFKGAAFVGCNETARCVIPGPFFNDDCTHLSTGDVNCPIHCEDSEPN